MNHPASREGTLENAETDYETIKAVGSGDIPAFELLIKKYRNPVLNFIFRYTGDRFGAEDIAQEVFLKVYLAASGFEPTGKVSTWIFKIAYNLSMNELLRRSRFVPMSGIDEIPAEQTEADDMSVKELAQEVEEAVRHLPEKQRAALLLRVNEGLSYSEIGDVLSTSIAAVESLLFRARENLRKILIKDV